MTMRDHGGNANPAAGLNLRIPNRTPSPNEPWKDDLLGRSLYGDALTETTQALADADNGASILLDGGYGAGKTFILDRWALALKGRGAPVRHYNAWAHDGDEDPLVSLVEALTQGDVAGRRDMLAAAGTLLLQLPSVLVPGLDKQRVKDSSANAAGAAFARAVEGRRQASAVLRQGLAQWAREAGNGPAVVIIDDLDRCRPAFALRVMERVKHVLSTPGLVFVFGASRRALTNAFLHEHGQGADADGYLLRLFDRELTLPPLRIDSDNRRRYVEALAEHHGLPPVVRKRRRSQYASQTDLWGDLALMLEWLSSGGSVTPREFERMVQALAIAMEMSTRKDGQKVNFLQPVVLLPMIVAKAKRPDAYERMVSAPHGAAGVVDCWADCLPASDQDVSDIQRVLNMVERILYRACEAKQYEEGHAPAPWQVLERIKEGQDVPQADREVLASKSRGLTAQEAGEWLEQWGPGTENSIEWHDLGFGLVRMWADRLNMIRLAS